MNPFDNAMRDVLSGTRYNRLTGRTADFKRILADLFRRIVEFIFEHFPFRFSENTGDYTRLIAFIFAVVGVVVVLVITFVVIRHVARRRNKPPAHDLSDIFEELARTHYTLDELLAISDGHVSHGRTREAVRYRFIAALVGLDERGVIRLAPSKTNLCLLQELSTAVPDLRVPFQEAVACFHYTWFGGKTVSAEHYACFAAYAEQLAKTQSSNNGESYAH